IEQVDTTVETTNKTEYTFIASIIRLRRLVVVVAVVVVAVIDIFVLEWVFDTNPHGLNPGPAALGRKRRRSGYSRLQASIKFQVTSQSV
ncbi:hypothetical protein BX616_008229, partial [Lobosporangium transversale]